MRGERFGYSREKKKRFSFKMEKAVMAITVGVALFYAERAIAQNKPTEVVGDTQKITEMSGETKKGGCEVRYSDKTKERMAEDGMQLVGTILYLDKDPNYEEKALDLNGDGKTADILIEADAFGEIRVIVTNQDSSEEVLYLHGGVIGESRAKQFHDSLKELGKDWGSEKSKSDIDIQMADGVREVMLKTGVSKKGTVLCLENDSNNPTVDLNASGNVKEVKMVTGIKDTTIKVRCINEDGSKEDFYIENGVYSE